MQSINTVTALAREGTIAFVIVNSPPVNALSRLVREGLIAAMDLVERDDDVNATILVCDGRTFIAGADISEFGQVVHGPTFKDVQNSMDSARKPIIAAIHGTALGGGLEVAMCAHYRIAESSARLGLPEVALGLVPGGGGTQRLPRLIGVERALDMVTSGRPIDAYKAFEYGLIDKIAPEGQLRNAAIRLARKVLADGAPIRRTRDNDEKLARDRLQPIFARFRQKANFGKFEAPYDAVRCIEAATDLPFDKGIEFERAIFETRKASPQSAAQRYAFFAERKAAKIPDVPNDTPSVPISHIGIIGAGTMGCGIAMCFANAGFPITIVERAPDILERGLSAIKGNYNQSVMRGRLSPEQASNRSRLITGSILPTDLSSCDLIIEAVFERMDIKQDVFATLDRVAKPDAILATNTSYLDVNTLAQSTTRPDRVLGMHFFSPANIMKLLEIVRGDKTAKTVLATAMRLAKQIGKVGVVVGVGPGFVGNRMLFQRTREAQEMILEGATPWEIDRVLTDFGFPMGPFQMSDLAGLDLGWVREESKGATLRDRLNEIGRHGQKSGAGYYDYVGGRKGIPSAVTEQIIRELMALKGATPRKLSDQEILQRSIYPMINEAANILLEGKALRASDIDVVWLNGYGWPAYRGGPTYYADRIGLSAIVGQIRNYGWAVSPLLEKLGEDGKCFADLSA